MQTLTIHSAPQEITTAMLAEHMLNRTFAITSALHGKIEYEFTRDAGHLHLYHQLCEHADMSMAQDNTSETLVARRGRLVLAGGKLTVSSPASRRPLPMESAGLDVQKLLPELELHNAAYAELSHIAMMQDYKDGLLLPEMMQRFAKRAIAEGARYVFTVAPAPYAANYRNAMHAFGATHAISLADRAGFDGIKMVLNVTDLSMHAPQARAKQEKRALAEA